MANAVTKRPTGKMALKKRDTKTVLVMSVYLSARNHAVPSKYLRAEGLRGVRGGEGVRK
jgi:hypothetical protein